MIATICEPKACLASLHLFDMDDPASLPLGMAGVPLPAQGETDAHDESGPVALEQPDKAELDLEQDAKGTTWGLDSAWRWRLMSLQRDLVRRNPREALVQRSGRFLQHLVSVIMASGVVSACR
jgi:hypothetical protein